MRTWRAAGFVLVAGMVFLITGIPGCGEGDNPALVGHPGYASYKKHCRRCHGSFGDGAKASRVAKRRVDLASPAFHDTTGLEDIRKVVSGGKGKMKGYAEKLTAEEIDVLARMVIAFPGRPAEAGTR